MTEDVITRARRTTRRRVTTVCLVAAVISAAVAAAVVVSAAASHRPGPSAPIAIPASPGAATGGGGADLPQDLAWSEIAGIAVPVSDRSGPYDTAGGLARGFAHDRAGAVLAAVHIVVRLNPHVGPAVFDPTLRTQVVGADTAAMRVHVRQAYDELRGQAGLARGQALGRLSAAVIGYQIASYRDDRAVLRLLTEAADAMGRPVRARTEVHMSWTGSDWALVAPAGGTFDQVVTVATESDVAAFLPFRSGR